MTNVEKTNVFARGIGQVAKFLEMDLSPITGRSETKTIVKDIEGHAYIEERDFLSHLKLSPLVELDRNIDYWIHQRSDTKWINIFSIPQYLRMIGEKGKIDKFCKSVDMSDCFSMDAKVRMVHWRILGGFPVKIGFPKLKFLRKFCLEYNLPFSEIKYLDHGYYLQLKLVCHLICGEGKDETNCLMRSFLSGEFADQVRLLDIWYTQNVEWIRIDDVVKLFKIYFRQSDHPILEDLSDRFMTRVTFTKVLPIDYRCDYEYNIMDPFINDLMLRRQRSLEAEGNLQIVSSRIARAI